MPSISECTPCTWWTWVPVRLRPVAQGSRSVTGFREEQVSYDYKQPTIYLSHDLGPKLWSHDISRVGTLLGRVERGRRQYEHLQGTRHLNRRLFAAPDALCWP
eukprot:scaffold337_cov393-Prasinococcus_capsulatus_cf.AAC.9